jgi:hypothetical protein
MRFIEASENVEPVPGKRIVGCRSRRAGMLAAIVMALAGAGCVSVGQPFPVERVPQIRIGVDTPADIERAFGKPWRTGIEDGQTTWTYGDYKRSLFGDTRTRDLVVRFAPNGVVASYSFSSDLPEDAHIKPKTPEPIF